MTTSKDNKTTRRDSLRLLLNGMQLHLLPLKTITIAGVVHQVTDLMAQINADIAQSDASEKAHAAWIQQVDQEQASHTALDPLVSGTKQFVRLQFGNTDAAQATLADFGMTPPKKRAVSPATKVAAAKKAVATREARGTKGSVQKKAITGATAPTPVPVVGTEPVKVDPTPAAAPAAGPVVPTK